MKASDVKSGIELITDERERQVAVEGWTSKHDDEHDGNQIAMAAACYATGFPTKVKVEVPCNCRTAECQHIFGKSGWVDAWPWAKEWDKRGKHDRLKQLAIAGALIAAEIDRLQRSSAPPAAPKSEDTMPSQPPEIHEGTKRERGEGGAK